MGFDEQRAYVNQEFARRATGKSLTKAQKTRLLKLLWREAKRRYP